MIDTEQLSAQVRELLSSHSIGQRVFGTHESLTRTTSVIDRCYLGEAVLNLSQGTVSEILAKPRPWHALSIKGREPYIRMYTWFHDASGNVQKLLAWKRDRDGNRHTVLVGGGRISSFALAVRRTNRSGTISINVSETKNRHTSKRRCLFTDDQRRVLKQIFEDEPYPSQTRLERLTEELALPINKISNWFHNARMRTKTALPIDEAAPSTHDDDDFSPIVPPNSSLLDSDDSSAVKTAVSLVDHQPASLSVSASCASSKKRKSIPQKLITTKKFGTTEHESTIS